MQSIEASENTPRSKYGVIEGSYCNILVLILCFPISAKSIIYSILNEVLAKCTCIY
jgi:hypothetical protein